MKTNRCASCAPSRSSILLKAPPSSTRSSEIASVSKRIRTRLENANHTFRANDNIAEFIEDGELEELRLEVEGRMNEVLDALVIDTENDHNAMDTARRVAKLFVDEVFAGRYRAAPSLTSFPNVARLNQLMIVGPITVRSACSHHLCPILGKIWFGVLPNIDSELIGLSKFARLCNWIMNRPQIQEEAMMMLADELERRLRPDGLAIVMQADHFCMHWRGIMDEQPETTTSIMRGAFLESDTLRREFFELRGRRSQ